MEEEFRDIASYFQRAHDTLASSKCRTTACGYFNLAQRRLDRLEHHPNQEVASAVRKARIELRKLLDQVPARDQSLRYILRVYSDYWRVES